MFKNYDVSIMFLFETTLSSVKAENGINVIFTSGVACPLEDERLSIVATFFPPRHCKFETSLNQLKNESVSDKKKGTTLLSFPS